MDKGTCHCQVGPVVGMQQPGANKGSVHTVPPPWNSLLDQGSEQQLDIREDDSLSVLILLERALYAAT